MKSLFYHATPYKNIFSIAHNGLRPPEDGFVKLCNSIEDAVCFGVHTDVCDGDCFVVLSVLLDVESVERYSEYTYTSIVPFQCYRHKGCIPSSCIALGMNDILQYTYYTNTDSFVRLLEEQTTTEN